MKDIVYGEKVALDNTDKKIIQVLYSDGRMPISEMSRKTGIRRDIIVYRLKKMLENDVVSFILPILNPPKLGFQNLNTVNIRIQNFEKKLEDEFISFLKNNKNIIYVSVLSGNWDYNVLIASKNPEHFNEIIKDMRSKFSNFIKEFDVSMVIKEPKYENMLGLL